MSIASIGIDFGVLNALNLWVACLLPPRDGQAQIVNIVFHEDRPDLGRIELISREPGARIASTASDLFLPWCNYNRMLSLWLWQGWIEGTNLCALTAASAPAIRIALEAPPSRLIRPALSVASGEFDVPFVLAGGKQLALVRFLPEREGSAGGGSILWRVPLAKEPVAARAALGPANSGSLRRLVLVLQETNGLALELIDLATGRQPPGASSLRLPNVHAIPGAEPGVRVDEQGSAHVALLVASNAAFTELSIVDVSFIAGRDVPPTPKIEPARKLTVPPVAAGIAFQSRPDSPMRRDWIVLLADGTLVHSQSKSKPMQTGGKPVTPLELVALTQSTYVLTLKVEGPDLEPLR